MRTVLFPLRLGLPVVVAVNVPSGAVVAVALSDEAPVIVAGVDGIAVRDAVTFSDSVDDDVALAVTAAVALADSDHEEVAVLRPVWGAEGAHVTQGLAAVSEADAVPVGVSLAVPVAETVVARVAAAVIVAVPVVVPVLDTVLLALTLLDDAADTEPVRVKLAVAEAVDVLTALFEDDAVWVDAALLVDEAVAVGVPEDDCVPLLVTASLLVLVAVPVDVADSVCIDDTLPLPELLAEAVLDGETVDAALSLTVVELVMLGLDVADVVCAGVVAEVMDPVILGEAVTVSVDVLVEFAVSDDDAVSVW
jgi:hypothetical protein